MYDDYYFSHPVDYDSYYSTDDHKHQYMYINPKKELIICTYYDEFTHAETLAYYCETTNQVVNLSKGRSDEEIARLFWTLILSN